MVGLFTNVMNQFHVYQYFVRHRERYMARQDLPENLQVYLTPDLPDIEDEATGLDYLVLDFETTGLEAETNTILSMGWVEISNYNIDLETATQIFIESPDTVKAETAVINHIMPEMLQNGISLDEGMERLFAASKGKVLIAHGCVIESAFVKRYLQQRYGMGDLPVMWFDTLAIEKAMARAINKESNIDVRLSETRERYGLPEYNGHDALIDAIATAELFLAQAQRLFHKQHPCVGKLYRMSQ
ncbi:3'-5' exonuclease [Vibrio hippocampi]|uniref:DNA polymerase III PolC-type n=1 Tax=Vibrio hippocampi TaxID=654686 RepID=A0ABN8DL86_9VIBR|nr:3'-5' exonuclease [Vibrio hippocampi]CAH0528724.1 DNA polymerase III PolC-type [Vibrio hippocampi]